MTCFGKWEGYGERTRGRERKAGKKESGKEDYGREVAPHFLNESYATGYLFIQNTIV